MRGKIILYLALVVVLGAQSGRQAAALAAGESTQYLPFIARQLPAELSVNAAENRRAISPLIYGMNFTDEDLAAELRLPIRRWGGNATSRYNWRTDTHNTGRDWFYENIVDSASAQLPNGSSVDLTVEQNRRTGTQTVLTLPLIGWTPKPRAASPGHDCGFKVSKYGPQQSIDPWDSDCGSGIDQNGNNITANSPTDTSVAIDSGFVSDWIDHLKGRYGSAAAGGVQFYNLDNEPMLWFDTHRDVHPGKTTYDELRGKTYQIAAAVKQADADAKTLGPVLWGWCAYFYSARDGCYAGADYLEHNNTYFVEWYLQQMQAYEQLHGVRILDYLDLHFYPQGEDVFSDAPGSAQVQAQRLRSTRLLWDPSYTDDSWIPEPVYLIPRMRAWVEKNYPGTRLAITEYSWGAQGSLNGALAQAEILGIFGREGLDLATLWAPPTLHQPGAFAFRMYRNYDGAGSAFGDTSVYANSAAPDTLSVYAAQRSADGALTIMVINKSTASLTRSLQVSNFNATTAQVYTYSGANLNEIVRSADQPASAGSLSLIYPASSITLIVLPGP